MDLAPNTPYIHADVAATYNGGLASSKTNFLFVCNHSTPSSTVWFDPVGEQHYTSGQSVLIYVHSRHVCWDVHPSRPYIPSSLGGVLLTIGCILVVAYIVFGSLGTFIIKGTIQIPHEDFWSKFFDNVATGAIFIFSCGKKTSLAPTNYNNI